MLALNKPIYIWLEVISFVCVVVIAAFLCMGKADIKLFLFINVALVIQIFTMYFASSAGVYQQNPIMTLRAVFMLILYAGLILGYLIVSNFLNGPDCIVVGSGLNCKD